MTAHQNPAEPGPGEPLYGPESASTPVGGTPGGPNPLNGPQTGAEDFHREQEAPGDSLREQIAEALMRWAENNNNPKFAPMRRPETVTRNAYGRADAVLAVIEPIFARLKQQNSDLARAYLGLPAPEPIEEDATEAETCDHDSQVMDHEGAQYWVCMKCGQNLGRLDDPPGHACTDGCRGVTGIRGLLEHVGIDTTGHDITVNGKVVDAAHDTGPSVAEATADDRAHWPERQWGGS